MIKKVMVSLTVLVMFVFLVGCLDYKAYDIPADDVAAEDLSLIDEIAQIENELNLEEEAMEEVEEEVNSVEEEIILPELTEEPENVDVYESDMDAVYVKENELVNLNVKVTDPDQDVVTHTFSKPLNKEGEWQTNYGDAGEYVITITATDGKLTTEKKIKIVVERVNVAPVVTGVKDLLVDEGDTVSFEPKVSDPNGDAVSVTVSEPLKSGNLVTDHNSAGEYQVRVLASDGELETEKVFKLTITDVNELPEVTGLVDLVVKEGEIVEVKPVVSDLDNDDLTITISEPVGSDGVWETGYTDHGEYVVVITINDGKDTVTKKVAVTVEDVNMPPVIVDVSLN
ncbi:hypothetical protein HOE37_03535 [Candidatus Woesearchaeota archaeon]|jgi:hypothetical protein|nr:hypothetical protein [Candidatus Woesearchaeota archaeon]MBT4110903.1 hypothetical protein [Candidatus Woesearchaeota archaeon]MBT4336585.1 hypothetical protein [Candidatus Woesearchaeota archaeon]MBT4469666.1 hypothetical protein [Candidatus Woesearchaeota archaeon]MBT6744028.1 hypothetical protein [Candidatus Woesearchaeota archaeon]